MPVVDWNLYIFKWYLPFHVCQEVQQVRLMHADQQDHECRPILRVSVVRWAPLAIIKSTTGRGPTFGNFMRFMCSDNQERLETK